MSDKLSLLDHYTDNRFRFQAWDPAALLSKGKEFFQWCKDNPRSKQIIDKHTGEPRDISLPRSPTKEGLCR